MFIPTCCVFQADFGSLCTYLGQLGVSHHHFYLFQSKKKKKYAKMAGQAMITLQEMAVFNSLYCSKVTKLIYKK